MYLIGISDRAVQSVGIGNQKDANEDEDTIHSSELCRDSFNPSNAWALSTK